LSVSGALSGDYFTGLPFERNLSKRFRITIDVSL
jgi:hypothetical protein